MGADDEISFCQRRPDAGVNSGHRNIETEYGKEFHYLFHESLAIYFPILGIGALDAVQQLGNGYHTDAERLILAATDKFFNLLTTTLHVNNFAGIEDYAHGDVSGKVGWALIISSKSAAKASLYSITGIFLR